MNIELLIAGIVVLIIVVGLVGWMVGVYNGLVMRRNDVDKAFANIDVLLKQRADQIPDLMRVVQNAMNHEHALFTRLSDARQQYLSASSLNDKVDASNQLNAALKSVIAVAEGYPTLISGPNMVELQQAISAVEERIADRREFFNESVNLYNIAIAVFPDLFFARMLSYQRIPLLAISAEETRYEGVKLEVPGA
ncbi:LemA family protein [Pseudomonas reactans]|uniref:LemA family protein n=1 Tax=Pseudomonas reactans TaxID=117680 RepID=UPI0015A4CB52|nr:LemA family protein [Pseudomonas reactans]NWA69633.1 LemA family protein [Pseudomonas reactans]